MAVKTIQLEIALDQTKEGRWIIKTEQDYIPTEIAQTILDQVIAKVITEKITPEAKEHIVQLIIERNKWRFSAFVGFFALLVVTICKLLGVI